MNSNQQRKQKIIFEIYYKGNATNALKAVEKFKKENVDALKSMGKNYDIQAKQLSSRNTRGFRRAGNASGKAYASGFKESINMGGKNPLDDFIYKSESMRGVTTGLRHEIGKLRNTFLLIAFATSGVVAAFKDWFQESLRTQAAMIGLQAVATSTGLSFKVLSDYSKELETEGFLSIGGSAAALKNLASANLNLSETQRVLAALTDAAAFNRQGTLSVEEAVIGATQGIKNQNCEIYNTPIYDPVRGETRTIEEWHDAGIVPCVLSLNRQTGLMEVIQAEYLHYNGENEVFEVELENGHTRIVTANHQFLTQDGFKFTNELDLDHDVLYYIEENLINSSLNSIRNKLIGDLCQQNQIVENVENRSLQMLLQDCGVKNNSVKGAGLKKSMKSTDSIIQSLINGLKLTVESVENVSSLLKSVSTEDMEIFAQNLAEIKITEYKTLEKIVAGILVELLSNVKNVELNKAFLQEKFKEVADSVLGNVKEIGGQEPIKVKILPIGEEEPKENEIENGEIENINNGNNKYSSAIGYNVANVMSFAQVIITRIIYTLKPNTLNGNLNQIMVSPYVQDVIEMFTQEMTIHLKNSSVCTPTPQRVVKISLKNISRTYELSVPINFNYSADCIIESNSIMVDNAGITKNLSIMQREYAAQIGTTSGRLTEQQKRQAITNGILKEAALFAGNAEKSLSTYQGKITKFNTTLLQSKRALGDLIAPDIVDGLSILQEVIQTSSTENALTGGVKIITNYLKSGIVLSGIMLKNLEHFVMPLEKFASAITSPITKLALLAVGLNKVRGYVTGFASNSLKGALASTGNLDATKAGLVQQMAMQNNLQKSNNILNTQGVAKAQQRLEITRMENTLINDKNLAEKTRLFLQKEIQTLTKQTVLSKQEELRLQLALNNATKMGFNVTKASSTQGFYKKGGIYLTKEGKDIKGDNLGTRDLSPALGQYTKNIFALKKIISFEIVAGFKQMGAAAKLAFTELRSQGIKSILTMKGVASSMGLVAAGAKQVANGIKLIGSAILATVLNVLSVILVFNILKDLWDSLIEKPKEMSIEHQKAIDLEKKSIEGLTKKYIEVNAAITSNTKTFSGSTGFIGLFTDKGNSIKQVNDRLGDTKKEMESILQAMNEAKGDEKAFDTLQEKLKETQTEFSTYYTEITNRNDQFNQTLETTLEQLESLSTSFGGGFGKILSQVKSLQELANFTMNSRQDLSTIGISENIAGQLGLQKDQRTMYYALSKVAEIKFGQELSELVRANEKKITDIKQKEMDARLSLVDNSIFKEVALTKKSYEAQIQDLMIEKQSIESDLAKSSFGKTYQDLQLATQKTMNEGQFSQMNNEVLGLIEKMNTSSIFDELTKLNLELIKTSKGFDFYEPAEKINKLNDLLLFTRSAIQDIQQDSSKGLINLDNIDGYRTRLNALIRDVSSNSPSALLSKEVLSKLQNSDVFKNVKMSFREFEDLFGSITKNLTSMITNVSSTKIQEKMQNVADKSYGAYMAAGQKVIGALNSLQGTFEDAQIKSIEKVIFKYSDLTQEHIEQAFQLKMLGAEYSSASSNVEGYYKDLNNYQKTQEIENYNLNLSLEQLKEAYKDDKEALALLRELQTKVEHIKVIKDEINLQGMLNDILVKQNALYRDNARKMSTTGKGLSMGLAGDSLGKFEDWTAQFNSLIADTALTKGNSDAINQFFDNLVLDLEKGFADKASSRGTGDPFISGILGLDTTSLDFTLNQLDILQKAFGPFSSVLNNALEEAKFQEQLDFNLKAVKEFTGMAIDYFYSLGKSIGEGFLLEKEVHTDRKTLIEEQTQLYKNGELTRLEFSQRIAQIEEYTAKRIKNIWIDIGNSVVTSAIDMTAEVIKQIGIAQAAKAAADASLGVFGAVGKGLTAALPFLGIATALGIGASLLSAKSEPTLTFDQTKLENSSSFGGTIKAEDVHLTISPTFLIEGNQVFIGSGSVIEYTEQATELMKQAIQQSIDNNELDLNLVRSVS